MPTKPAREEVVPPTMLGERRRTGRPARSKNVELSPELWRELSTLLQSYLILCNLSSCDILMNDNTIVFLEVIYLNGNVQKQESRPMNSDMSSMAKTAARSTIIFDRNINDNVFKS